ncbi:MAG TPA: long-chain-fatty-acid--CoA ligase [Acidimicrobiales bacterium]|nr:long-chain-fatty-acid--CoA ligase [Acidimicrobiales bacterium]
MDDPYTISGLLRTQASRRPDACMLVDGELHRSWSEQLERSSQVAQALVAEGVGVGDRVAFVDRNGAAFFDLAFGAALAGAVMVPVSWRLAPPELAAVVDDAEASLLVVHADYLAQASAAGSGPSVRRVVVLGDSTGDRGSGRPELSRRLVRFTDWVADRPARDPGHVASPGEVALQLYTSGTTGLPKGAMLTNANVSFAVEAADRRFGAADDTVSLVAMPLFHIGGAGWALCAMSRGGRSVILRDVDPAELIRLVVTEGVTDTFVVPAALMFVLATPGVETADFSSLRTIFYGASPISEDLLVRCLRTFRCRFAQLYGLTETTGAICALAPEDHDPEGPRRHLLRAAGRPYPEVELRIVDPDTGKDVAAGEVGEVWTRSPLNMLGYFRHPDETARVLTPDGWLRTGDAGYLDEEGYLFLHDRIKDMIVTGGENVFPAEVENVLLSHDQVADAAVIGVPDDRWGETVKALVVAAPPPPGEQAVTPADLVAYCRERLAHYKCPTSVELVDALPRTPTGKILKRELRAPYWHGHERRIH